MKNLLKNLLTTTLILTLSLSTIACSNNKDENANDTTPNKTSKQELNIFTWQGYVPSEVIDDFEDETGIKVNYANFSTNEEMLSKIQAQKGQFDIIICSDYIIDLMVQEENLIDEIDWSKLKNSDNIEEAYKNQYYDPENKYSIPYATATGIIVYDEDKVDFEIKGYKDLWNKEFKDSLVVLDGRDIIGITEMMLGYSVNETDPIKLEEVKKSMLELKENIIVFDADTPQNALLNGDAIAGYMFPSQYIEAKKSMPSLQFVYPEEGMAFYIDNIVLPKDAPNLESAYAFMDYILEGEVSAKISTITNYPNLNTSAKEFLPKEYIENKAMNIDKSSIQNVQIYKNLGDYTEEYDKIWTEFKAN